jgi:hypothetical protein
MNANELEEHLKFTMFNEVSYCKDFIRQQQAEIEALKAENERLFASMLTMALDEEVRKANEK